MNVERVRRLLDKRTYEEAMGNRHKCLLCPKLEESKCSLDFTEEEYLMRLARGYCGEWEKDDWRKFLQPSDRIKLVLFSSALLCGGAERWLVSLASSFDPKIFEICVAIRYPDLIDINLIQKLKNVEHVVFGNRQVQKVGDAADIFLAWDSFPKTKANISIFCSHGCDALNLELVNSYGKRRDYIFTAVSTKAASIWRSKHPTVIHNGSEITRLQAPPEEGKKLRKELGVEDSEILIGYISRIIPAKNPHLVAKAAHVLRNRGIPAKALYVGEANKDVPIKHEALFLPRTEFLGDIFQAIDCFMLPSISEAFSLAINEAWLTKTPVIATAVGSIPELERKYGSLVVRMEGHKLADTVLQAVSVKNLETVQRAYDVACCNFTEERMTQRWTKFLLSLDYKKPTLGQKKSQI